VFGGGRGPGRRGHGKGFAVEKLDGRVPLFFATGSGISAVRSVIESRDWAGTGARLYLGNRSQARICYAERFADWAARGVQVVPVVSQPEETWAGATGHVQDVYATEALPGDQVAAVFCGVKPMVQDTQALLTGHGMAEDLALLNF
jgi:NAD(P)H-flavin reductase